MLHSRMVPAGTRLVLRLLIGRSDIKQLIFGELTVLLGIVWGFATIRDARKKEHDK